MCVRRLWGWFWIKERKSHFFPQHTLYVFTTIKLIFLNSLVLCALFSQNVSKHISWEWDSITDRGKPNTISENVKCLLVISLIQCIQSVKKNNIHHQALVISLQVKLLSNSYLTLLPSWHKSNTKRGVKKSTKLLISLSEARAQVAVKTAKDRISVTSFLQQYSTMQCTWPSGYIGGKGLKRCTGSIHGQYGPEHGQHVTCINSSEQRNCST